MRYHRIWGAVICVLLATTSLLGRSTPSKFRVAAPQISFAFDSFKALVMQSTTPTVLFSPVASYMGLSAIHLGARDTTLEALESLLKVEQIPPDQYYTSMNGFHRALMRTRSDGGFNFSNSLWVQQGQGIRPEWATNAKGAFGLDINHTDLGTDQGIVAIQRWGGQGGPMSLAEQGSKQGMVLASDVTLRASLGMEVDTAPSSKGKFLKKTQVYMYLQGNGFQVVSLPYAGRKLSLILVLPDTTLATFYTRLNPYSWSRWALLFSPRLGTLRIPKLSISDVRSGLPIISMRYRNAIRSDKANFRGINDQLHLVDILQFIRFSIDEMGPELVAQSPSGPATSVPTLTQRVTQPFLLQFNKPFFFAVQDNTTGAILVMGQVIQ